jgi:hypothetical protein
MPLVTTFIVQAFVQRGRKLVAEPPMSFTSEDDALARAGRLPERKDGVAVWSQTGDPDMDVWDDEPRVLYTAGRVPREFLGEE